MIFRIEQSPKTSNTGLSSRKQYMQTEIIQNSRCPLKAGDIIRVKEGYFVLDKKLRPSRPATDKEIDRA
jgi:hypothetical protein